MTVEKEFTLLKIENRERINDDEEKVNYLIINVLDESLTPCKFFVFKKDLVEDILNDAQNAKALSKVLISFDLNYNGKLWNCNLETMLFNY